MKFSAKDFHVRTTKNSNT